VKLKGLIVREEPMSLILKGVKKWELRSKRCHIRGKIALITSGSGTVVGTAEVVDCIGPLTVEQWNNNLRRMGMSREDRIKSKREIGDIYAWVIKSAKKLKKPVRYKHKPGVIKWHPVDV